MANSAKKRYTRYTKAHLRFRNIRFWIAYLVLLALIVMGFVRVHAYFDECLNKYEASRYSLVADEFAKIFTEKRFDELYEYEEKDESVTATKEEYVAYLTELTDGAEIEYTRIAAESSTEIRYLVTADGKSFAEFTLEKTGETYGFEVIPLIGYTVACDIYEPGNIYISILQPTVYDYKIPSYATITVDGVELGEESIIGEEKLFFDGHMPSSGEAYTLVSYRFTTHLGKPEVRVTDEQGDEITLRAMGQDIYEFEYQYDDSLKDEYEATAVEFVERWCAFSTHNKSQNYVLDVVVKNSTAYSFIRNYETTWITEADKYSFSDVSTANFLKLDEEVVCCEVSLTHYTKSKGKENTYPVRMRVYMQGSGKNIKIYDFEILEASEE